MGGIVVRRYLVQRAADLINADKKVGLFLIASPSLGADYANWLTPLAQLFGHAQADVLKFSQTNQWLNDLDKDFINLKEAGKLKVSGKELIEDTFVVLKKLVKKQVVQPFQGAKYFGEAYKVPESDHFSIAKPRGKEAIQHRQLCQFIGDFTEDPLDVHANVLRLSVSRDRQGYGLWVTNSGTHAVRDIEIVAIPDDESWFQDTHGGLPGINGKAEEVELVSPIAGGWFMAKVRQLNPDRGLMIAGYNIEPGEYSQIDFDLFWNDHEGMQRKSQGAHDVATGGDLTLRARETAKVL